MPGNECKITSSSASSPSAQQHQQGASCSKATDTMLTCPSLHLLPTSLRLEPLCLRALGVWCLGLQFLCQGPGRDITGYHEREQDLGS